MDHDLELVAHLELFGLDRKRQFAEGERAFGLAADVDEQFVLVLRDDQAGEDLAFIEDLEAFFVETLLEGELVFFFFDDVFDGNGDRGFGLGGLGLGECGFVMDDGVGRNFGVVGDEFVADDRRDISSRDG
jgi:hypothetical protein